MENITSSIATKSIALFALGAILHTVTPALKSFTTLQREDVTVKALMDKNSTFSRTIASTRSVTMSRLEANTDVAKDKAIAAINKLPD